MKPTKANITSNAIFFDWSLFLKTFYNQDKLYNSKILQTLYNQKINDNENKNNYVFDSIDLNNIIKVFGIWPIQILDNENVNANFDKNTSLKLEAIEADLAWLKEFVIELNEKHSLEINNLKKKLVFLDKELTNLRKSHPPIITKLSEIELENIISENESFANDTFYNETFYSCV